MPLYLKSDTSSALPGLTFYSDNLLGTWARPTGVYLPPSVDLDQGVVNVLLWLHGYYVSDIGDLFKSDRSKIREQVFCSNKSVVLVAPHLGNGSRDGSSTFTVGFMKGQWGELYLNQVLGALAPARDPQSGSGLKLGKLVIACHSGGGSGMRNLVGALGRYGANLAECWGFDCLYGVKVKPDDASFWYDWAGAGNGRSLFVSFASSTVPQSVKLHLMVKGLADRSGARRDPKGAQASGVTVKLGVQASKPVEALMGLDALLKAKPDGKFAEQAAGNLRKAIGDTSMALHYQVARDGLLERLQASSFL